MKREINSTLLEWVKNCERKINKEWERHVIMYIMSRKRPEVDC